MSPQIDQQAVPSDQMQRLQLIQLFKEKTPTGRMDLAERAAREFLDRLRQSSPIAAEKFSTGKMDDDELRSRIDVFLRDNPALAGAPVNVESSDPRKRVSDLLRRDVTIASTDLERLALADRFLERLGERSRTAHDDLVKGKMTDDELQSRVAVFIADIHAEAVSVAADPKKAAARAIVESYVKANFGGPTERANAIAYKGVVEAKGTKREFVIFKKRPGKLRMHIIENGVVIGILGFDGTIAWRQELSKPAVQLKGAEASTLARTARFDDPLIDFQEHGAEVKLEDKPEKGPLRLHLLEVDGTEIISEVDPTSYNQLISRSREAGGQWVETRFSEFHKVGALNMAYKQEEWADGKLRSTMQITEVRLDSGLLDQIFVYPTSLSLSYMDYMGGLSLIRTQQKRRVPYLQQNSQSVQ
jgi:hypothetical protein